MKNPMPYLLDSFREMLAPRHCLVCREYTGSASRRFEFICPRCSDRLTMAPSSEELINRLVSALPADDVALSNAYALFSLSVDFDFVEIIHALKYRGFKRVGYEFGKELGIFISRSAKQKYEAIVPIPIHNARRRERGFNQSEMIARGVDVTLGAGVRNDIVRRRVYTRTQTLLSADERRANVSNVFAPAKNFAKNKMSLSGQNILLVDDVFTTGSTLNSCATTLLEMGARSVDAAALASA